MCWRFMIRHRRGSEAFCVGSERRESQRLKVMRQADGGSQAAVGADFSGQRRLGDPQVLQQTLQGIAVRQAMFASQLE